MFNVEIFLLFYLIVARKFVPDKAQTPKTQNDFEKFTKRIIRFPKIFLQFFKLIF